MRARRDEFDRHGDVAIETPRTDSAPDVTVALTSGQLRDWALEVGFAEAGVVALPYAHEDRDGARFAEWLGQDRAGSMAWLARANEMGELLRKRVETPFPWARSVVVCWAPYHANAPRSTDPAPPGAGWIARYAWSSRIDPQRGRQPSDYHKVLLKRLRAVEARLRSVCGAMEARAFVDTGPVVERSLAVAAGLGWTGKNTCLIHPRLGSYGFLAVLLTSLQLDQRPPTAPVPDRCGSCTRCIQACPTGALIAPYQMDAARCIAYLTIEHRGPISATLMEGMGRQVFGCDICQDVCPWNRKAPIALDAELQVRPELVNPALEAWAALDEEAFERLCNGSPLRRTGFMGLRRNLAVAMGNSDLRCMIPLLESCRESVDAGLRSAARWALEKLRATNQP
jgi:epoxyqueuosine reductase